MDVFTLALLQVLGHSYWPEVGYIGRRLRLGPVQQSSGQNDCPRTCEMANIKHPFNI